MSCNLQLDQYNTRLFKRKTECTVCGVACWENLCHGYNTQATASVQFVPLVYFYVPSPRVTFVGVCVSLLVPATLTPN
jgi:hypothetical protein